jgi:hypothetical protein
MSAAPAGPRSQWFQIFAAECQHEAAEQLARIQTMIGRSKELIRESRRILAACNGRNPYAMWRTSGVLPELLRAAIEAGAADFANIQLFDPTSYELKIVAQQGFQEEFLRYFAGVRGSECACGSAMARRSRVVVADVAADSVFGGRRSAAVVLRAQVRSLQSTPLVDPAGNFLGVLSTHYRRPGKPSQRALRRIDRVITCYLPRLIAGSNHH